VYEAGICLNYIKVATMTEICDLVTAEN